MAGYAIAKKFDLASTNSLLASKTKIFTRLHLSSLSSSNQNSTSSSSALLRTVSDLFEFLKHMH